MGPSVFQLQCTCNNYPWGRVGRSSLFARLCSKTPNIGFAIEDKPYAEMWMGDYQVQPAKSLKTGEELHKIVDEDKEGLLGKNIVARFGGVLPFLPKILSIDKALEQQIHPNKDLAAKLHAQNPDQFTDDNHKPEIAIALGKFEVFAGWKATPDIQALFDGLEPIKKFLPSGQTQFNNETLRQVCRNILTASDESIKECQEQLGKLPREKFGKQAYILDLLPRLQGQYSIEDPGNLVTLLCMNFLTLEAGEAIYVPADCQHAYLSGDIVECMARSNNVLNTGFCPRAKRDSIDLFTEALTFSPHNAEDTMLKPAKSSRGKMGKTLDYAPPMSEFNMFKTTLQTGETEVQDKIAGPSIIFATNGAGKMKAGGEEFDINEGYIFFSGPGVGVELSSGSGLEVYRAYAE